MLSNFLLFPTTFANYILSLKKAKKCLTVTIHTRDRINVKERAYYRIAIEHIIEYAIELIAQSDLLLLKVWLQTDYLIMVLQVIVYK